MGNYLYTTDKGNRLYQAGPPPSKNKMINDIIRLSSWAKGARSEAFDFYSQKPIGMIHETWRLMVGSEYEREMMDKGVEL